MQVWKAAFSEHVHSRLPSRLCSNLRKRRSSTVEARRLPLTSAVIFSSFSLRLLLSIGQEVLAPHRNEPWIHSSPLTSDKGSVCHGITSLKLSLADGNVR